MDGVVAQQLSPNPMQASVRPRDDGRPKRVLIGWELGAGLGHVGMLRPLALALRDDGCRVVMALRETVSARSLIPDPEIEIVQAPYWSGAGPSGVDMRTMADVLWLSGFADALHLYEEGRAWADLVERVDPQLVIGEYSPGLALAALGARRYVTVGSGFSVPPPVAPAPPFRYWEASTPQESRERERQLETAVAAARKALGLPPLRHWSELFGGDFVGVCTFPALDGYKAYRRAPALGPISHGCVEPPTAERQRIGAFAYLTGLAPDFDTIVDGIAAAGVPAHAYCRDLSGAQREQLCVRGVTVHDAPQDLYRALPGKAVIIHHGGLSTTHVAIETGTPQVILPCNTEQVITGQRIVDMKLGAGLSRAQRTVASVAEAVSRVVTAPSYRERAASVALRAYEHQGPSALAVLRDRCRQLLDHESA